MAVPLSLAQQSIEPVPTIPTTIAREDVLLLFHFRTSGDPTFSGAKRLLLAADVVKIFGITPWPKVTAQAKRARPKASNKRVRSAKNLNKENKAAIAPIIVTPATQPDKDNNTPDIDERPAKRVRRQIQVGASDRALRSGTRVPLRADASITNILKNSASVDVVSTSVPTSVIDNSAQPLVSDISLSAEVELAAAAAVPAEVMASAPATPTRDVEKTDVEGRSASTQGYRVLSESYGKRKRED